MKVVGIIMAFFVVLLIAFLTNGFISTQPVPNQSTAAGQQYNNLTNTTEIASVGFNGALLLFIVAIVLGGVFLLIWAVKR